VLVIVNNTDPTWCGALTGGVPIAALARTPLAKFTLCGLGFIRLLFTRFCPTGGCCKRRLGVPLAFFGTLIGNLLIGLLYYFAATRTFLVKTARARKPHLQEEEVGAETITGGSIPCSRRVRV
jgi:hypothetical protein